MSLDADDYRLAADLRQTLDGIRIAIEAHQETMQGIETTLEQLYDLAKLKHAREEEQFAWRIEARQRGER